jgi:hypothetical protein
LFRGSIKLEMKQILRTNKIYCTNTLYVVNKTITIKIREWKETQKGSPTVLVTALDIWGKPV